MKSLSIGMALVLISFTATLSLAQEKSDHDLVKKGEPVSGMSAQQEKGVSKLPDLQQNDESEDPRVPMIQESTLNDDTFDSWRAGEIFRDEEADQNTSTDSIKIIERQRQISPKPQG